MSRLERIPVPLLPTLVGTATLGNVYLAMGYPLLRHLSMWAAAFVLIIYILKIIKFPNTVKAEYEAVVPCSLYAGFSMITMILGSYIFSYQPLIGKSIWFLGLGIHTVHLIVFTYRNVIRSSDVNTFVPTWFVTYNGIMVSCVVGGIMQEPAILTAITYYGIAIYFILIPLMIIRLLKVELKLPLFHTQAVVLAPCSLCLVSYLNVIPNPNTALVYILYLCVLLSLGFILYLLPRFFAIAFHPGFAALTFPMAIGIVASTKMAGFLETTGNANLASVVTQISGVQVYVTTMIIGFVLLNFLIMGLRLERK